MVSEENYLHRRACEICAEVLQMGQKRHPNIHSEEERLEVFSEEEGTAKGGRWGWRNKRINRPSKIDGLLKGFRRRETT
ncbi:hypothetical protein CEXT_136971 [Caerostris extrusa]|uniref:Uncharacterized protein n=1 Tax=Caerostris extrusa TaxID=172846 RepID=A0AAV4WWY4_CAEEX|nr:hypothetical protein CEXT_136971 [Caerostris extrusa]